MLSVLLWHVVGCLYCGLCDGWGFIGIILLWHCHFQLGCNGVKGCGIICGFVIGGGAAVGVALSSGCGVIIRVYHHGCCVALMLG